MNSCKSMIVVFVYRMQRSCQTDDSQDCLLCLLDDARVDSCLFRLNTQHRGPFHLPPHVRNHDICSCHFLLSPLTIFGCHYNTSPGQWLDVRRLSLLLRIENKSRNRAPESPFGHIIRIYLSPKVVGFSLSVLYLSAPEKG